MRLRRALGITDGRKLTRDEMLLVLFLFYFDTEVVQLICKATNSKAREWVIKEGRSFKPAARTARGAHLRAGKQWVDVTLGEMYQFLGLRITMGAYPRQRMRMYWSEEDAELRLPSVADVMTRNRYEAILSHLSFAVVGDMTHAGDKLAKLREIDTLLLKRCREAWNIEQHFTMDESRVKLSSKCCPFTWLM